MDIQALYGKQGEFLPKEIAVTSLEGDNFGHWIIEAPYEFGKIPKTIRESNNCLTCFHHGLEWFDGDTPLSKVYDNLKNLSRYALRVYTRGEQKASLLRNILGRDIINLEDYEGPSLKNMPKDKAWCYYHGVAREESGACALNNARKIKLWLLTRMSDNTDPIYAEPYGALPKKKERTSASVRRWALNEPPKDSNIHLRCVNEPGSVTIATRDNGLLPASEAAELFGAKAHTSPTPPVRSGTTTPPPTPPRGSSQR